MQFKAAFVAAAIASLAAASPTPRDDQPGNTCSTGPIQCCNSVSSTSNPTIASLAGLLGIVLPAVNVAVGLLCSPISAIGIGGGACSAQAVCCEDNSSSLISIGCLPVQL
ncbi:hypothetical protein D9757_013736 [Collybiopsis confluens]|uniref:Hydrophobin n=1 Tax=Collybiopsis confluens TaxID=2823264 RepID=A0A8H5CZP3_9AGAR|nr:hypothetical protein D9757_013730 [Collybiopsis confluens]KAF5350950.1 hypothetical protein D9757_013736 [Collybiopsis confluens]